MGLDCVENKEDNSRDNARVHEPWRKEVMKQRDGRLEVGHVHDVADWAGM